MSIDSSIVPGQVRADWGSSYPQYDTVSDVKANYIANPLDTSKVKSGWDGVVDSLQTYPGLVYDGSYPPTYNISGGILYLDQGQDVIDSAADNKWIEVEGVYIADIENPIEPSDLKNTKSNIRKIKPDINSELKRV